MTTTTAADIRAASRAAARRQVRDAMLDAARADALGGGWACVRMGAVARRVGLSRQTLHAEFGTKEALGQALVLRESEAFLRDVTRALDGQSDLERGLREAVTHTLTVAAQDPLLQTVLAGATGGGDDSLLPLLTSRSAPLLTRSSDVLGAWVREHHPALDAQLVRDVVDSLVRLVVSHLVMPTAPAPEVAARLARLAVRGLAVRA